MKDLLLLKLSRVNAPPIDIQGLAAGTIGQRDGFKVNIPCLSVIVADKQRWTNGKRNNADDSESCKEEASLCY